MSNRAMFHIRFNHQAENEEQQWKLLFNGEELWLKNIVIDGLCATTKDWLPTENSYKWHISVFGTCLIKDKVAFINSATPDNENRQFRHLLKAISFTSLETLATFGVSYVSTGSVQSSFYTSSVYALFRLGLYYSHEIFWHKFVKIKK